MKTPAVNELTADVFHYYSCDKRLDERYSPFASTKPSASPKYAACTFGLFKSSSPVPSSVMTPVSST